MKSVWHYLCAGFWWLFKWPASFGSYWFFTHCCLAFEAHAELAYQNLPCRHDWKWLRCENAFSTKHCIYVYQCTKCPKTRVTQYDPL